ncbi:MAG: dimethylsulfonioproprionate lyase family protein [Paracoccaceae bacterium]
MSDPRWTRSPEDRRQLRRLLGPAGLPGSGRLRYGAAMHFHGLGLIDAAVLEAYRLAATRDEPVEAVLAQHGLAFRPPDADALTPEDRLRTLLAEIDHYLAGLSGPGIGETRAGLAQWQAGPVRGIATTANAVIAEWLGPALGALCADEPALAQAIAAASGDLCWITYDGYGADIGPDFPRAHAFASLVGVEPDAAIAAQDFDLGLFLIAPHVLYRDHCHAAPELYAPLTGPHGWRFAPDAPLALLPAHQPIWNEPHAPHLTKVGPTPFLCIYAWTRDAEAPAAIVPARDWPELEALRLGPAT